MALILKNIILASKSTDRSEILTRSKIPFDILATDIDEEKFKTKYTNPIKLARELARAKALEAKDKLLEKKLDAVIIAADTIVELNKEIIGKANNEKEAFEILKKLAGKTHNLVTGIAITETNNPKIIVESATTAVEFLDMSDEDIWRYIKSNEWKGRAGAYSIKDKASLFISKIIGSPSNVIGLPMNKIFKILKNDFGLNLLQIQ